MSETGQKPLENARHERFACEWAKGRTKTDAYIAAGYDPKNADANATRFMDNDGIRARKDWLQAQAATTAVLTITEKREFLARVVRAKLTELPDDSDIWQEITVSEDSIKRKMPDKLRAIAQDNDLAPEVEKAASVVNVFIGEKQQ